MADDKENPFRDFDARMAKIAPARQPESDEQGRPAPGTAHMGIHVGVELVAGVIGGALLGYGADYLLGTYPFGLLILLALGSAAGMLNAYRYIQRLGKSDEGGDGGGLNGPTNASSGTGSNEGDGRGQSS